jgi:hypothetical protein
MAPDLPQQIISTLVQQLGERVVRLSTRALAPTHFVIYLHPDDHLALSGLTRAITDDAWRSVDAEIERLSKQGATPLRRTIYRLARPWAPPPLPIERATTKRQIEFLPDPDGDLPRGRFTIVFQLPAPEQIDATGTATVSVTSGLATDRQGRTDTISGTPAPAYARIDLTDDSGSRTFEIRQDKTIVGRGGPGVWVDLKVRASTDVSQEHVRIRRDAQSGDFLIKDMSRNGTSVNGRLLPHGVSYDGDVKREIDGQELPLPAHAEIALANAVTLTFTRLPR